MSFAIESGRCVALVGESGSGKTTIGRCLAGLHPPSGGRILFDGSELAAFARNRPLAAPPHPDRVPEPVRVAQPAPQGQLLDRAAAAGAARPVPERGAHGGGRAARPRQAAAPVGDRFPIELSGGERQRVAIARALAAKPDLLICDEVTSALDVSVQAAVLELLSELQRDLRLSMLFITHNLGVVACVADSVLVMDRGSLCESGSVAQVLNTPADEYTQRLLSAAPCLPDAAYS